MQTGTYLFGCQWPFIPLIPPQTHFYLVQWPWSTWIKQSLITELFLVAHNWVIYLSYMQYTLHTLSPSNEIEQRSQRNKQSKTAVRYSKRILSERIVLCAWHFIDACLLLRISLEQMALQIKAHLLSQWFWWTVETEFCLQLRLLSQNMSYSVMRYLETRAQLMACTTL